MTAGTTMPSDACWPRPPVARTFIPKPKPIRRLPVPGPDRAARDVADERAVVHARPVRDEAEIAVVGREARERVPLDHVPLARRCEAQVDARDVAAAERREGRAARALHRAQL